MNITPNSFSDGGELGTTIDVLERFRAFGRVDAVDVGAESTAPRNTPITHEEEWQRWQLVLPLLANFKCTISADTFRPETIFYLVKFWKDHKVPWELYWNDVSGKFDVAVKDFLKEGERFHYVFCHNRAPERELAGKHMDYVTKDEGRLEEELKDFFGPFKHKRVVFDPCLGFSKTYDENWYVLNHFDKFQKLIKHERWLLGFSRKSFLKKRFGMEVKAELDRVHGEVLETIREKASGELWIRTHRPELLG